MSKSLDGVLTKKAHKKDRFTEQQVADLLACADPATGYHYFCKNFFYIQHPVQGKMLFNPFGFQTELLDAYHNHRFTINMLPRQMGAQRAMGNSRSSIAFWLFLTGFLRVVLFRCFRICFGQISKVVLWFEQICFRMWWTSRARRFWLSGCS